jgi:hypothetical protein
MTSDAMIREKRIHLLPYRLFPIPSGPSALREFRLHCSSEWGSRPFNEGADGEQ